MRQVKWVAALVVVMAMAMSANVANATLHGTALDLGYPDVVSHDLTTNYNYGTKLLSIIGQPQELILSPSNPSGTFGWGGLSDFSATVEVDHTGAANFSSLSNALLVKGDLGLGGGLETLYSSSKLLTFGYDDSLDTFYFTFLQNINSPLASIGDSVGVIVSAGEFQLNFANDGGFGVEGGKSDAFPLASTNNAVPEPMTAGLFGLSSLGIAMGLLRRRRLTA